MGGSGQGIKRYRWSIFMVANLWFNELFSDGFLGTSAIIRVAFTTGQGGNRDFSFDATRITSQRMHAVKKQLPDTSLKEKTTIHPIFLSLQNWLTTQCVWQRAIDWKTNNVSFIDSKVACVHARHLHELEDGHAEQSRRLAKTLLIEWCLAVSNFMTP